MAMSSRDLVLSLLDGDEVERTPVFPPFFGYFACQAAGVTDVQLITDPDLAAKAIMDVGQECGFDGMDMIFDFLSPAQACGSKVKMPNYGLIPVTDPVIKDLGDLDRLQVPDPREDLRFVSSLSTATEIQSKLGRSHFLYATVCAPFTLLGELRGLERLFFDLIIEPGAVREMLRFSAEVLKGYYQEIETLSPDAFAVVDPTSSGNLLNEENFRKFVLPVNTGVINSIKRGGHKVLWHICGDSFNNLRSMSSLDVDMLSVDQPVCLQRMADVFPNAAIVGNLPPEGALTGGPPFEVVRQSVECMEEMVGRKHILAAGCGLTLDCSVEDVKMMRFSSEQYSMMRR